MTYSFTPTFKDTYFATIALTLRSPFVLVIFCLFPAATIYLLFLILQSGRIPSLYEVFVILLGFAFPISMLFFSVWLSRRKNKSAKEEHKYSFTEDGIFIQGKSFDVNLKWDAIYRIRETSKYIFFFLGSKGAYYLPKRVIDELGIIELRKLFMNNKLIPLPNQRIKLTQ